MLNYCGVKILGVPIGLFNPCMCQALPGYKRITPAALSLYQGSETGQENLSGVLEAIDMTIIVRGLWQMRSNQPCVRRLSLGLC